MRTQERDTVQKMRLLTLVGMALLSLVLSACSGPSTTPTSEATQAIVSTSQPASPTALATSTSVLPTPTLIPGSVATFGSKPQSTLRFGFSAIPRSLGPRLSAGLEDDAILYDLYDFLLRRAPSGGITPMALDSWVLSPDGKSVVGHVRKGIKFHDGVELTIEDILFSFEQSRGESATGRFRDVIRGNLGSMQAIDAERISIAVTGGLWDTALTLQPVYPKRHISQVGWTRFAQKPVGSGPFKFVEFTAGDHLILEANDGYWDKEFAPKFKRAILQEIPDAGARLAALKSGQVDFINKVSVVDEFNLRRSGDIKIFKQFQGAIQWVYFSNLDPSSPVSKRDIRGALRGALNRTSIIERFWSGLADYTECPCPPFARGSGSDLGFFPYGSESVRRAREAVASSGYHEGLVLGEQVPIYADAGTDGIDVIVREVGGYWKQIGVEARVKKVTSTELAGLLRQRRATSGVITTVRSVHFDNGATYYAWFHSRGEFSQWNVPAWDAAIEKALSARDPAQRAQALDEVAFLVFLDIVAIPLLNPYDLYGARETVRSWAPTRGATWFRGLHLVIPRWVE